MSQMRQQLLRDFLTRVIESKKSIPTPKLTPMTPTPTPTQISTTTEEAGCDHVYVRDTQSCMTLCEKIRKWEKPFCVIYYLRNCRYCQEANREVNSIHNQLTGVCWIKCEISHEKENCKQLLNISTFPHIQVFDGKSTRLLTEHERSARDYLTIFACELRSPSHDVSPQPAIAFSLNEDDVISSSSRALRYPCIILFYANWCRHCLLTKPEWNDAMHEMGNYVTPYAVSDEDKSPIVDYKIRGYPTIIGYDVEKNVHIFDDERSSQNLIAFCKSLL